MSRYVPYGSNMTTLSSLIGGFVFETLLRIPGAYIIGFTVKTLWEWFILPVFTSAPSITVLQAAGINLVISFLTVQLQVQVDEETTIWEDAVTGFMKAIMLCVSILLSGAIIRYLLM